MPTLDQCHDQVVRALQKDGWVVQPMPLYLTLKRRRAYIDIQATRQNNGATNNIMVVEVKYLSDTESLTTDIYIAIGQYLIYRTLLRQKHFMMPIYLAVPERIYSTIFDQTCSAAGILDNPTGGCHNQRESKRHGKTTHIHIGSQTRSSVL